jgi:hypothetical protein
VWEVSEPKTTTLNEIRKFNPCKDGWEKLLKFLNKTKADDEPLLMSTILKSNGLSDAIWCLRVFHGDHRQAVVDFACDCAESVLPIWEEWAKVNALEKIETPRQAITMARNSSCADAVHAANAACAARAADAAARAHAHAASYAAYAAAHAARAASSDAADAADDAAYAVADAVYAHAAAYAVADAVYAHADAYDAHAAAEKVMQKKLLIKYFG